jgi:hypothetical protein
MSATSGGGGRNSAGWGAGPLFDGSPDDGVCRPCYCRIAELFNNSRRLMIEHSQSDPTDLDVNVPPHEHSGLFRIKATHRSFNTDWTTPPATRGSPCR